MDFDVWKNCRVKQGTEQDAVLESCIFKIFPEMFMRIQKWNSVHVKCEINKVFLPKNNYYTGIIDSATVNSVSFELRYTSGATRPIILTLISIPVDTYICFWEMWPC